MKHRRLVTVAAAMLAAAGAHGESYAERYAAGCASCHGAQGVSTLAMTPSLAGQPSFYAITQLFLFREGRRDNAAMVAVAKALTDDDLRGFADLIGTLPAPAAAPAHVEAARMARGAALADSRRCTNCHGADLAGGRQVPRLAGQREDYLQHAMRGFRDGTRPGYTPAMAEALAGLAPTDLDDLAHYLTHVPARIDAASPK